MYTWKNIAKTRSLGMKETMETQISQATKRRCTDVHRRGADGGGHWFDLMMNGVHVLNRMMFIYI